MKIKEKHPNAHFFVPLRNKQWFTDSGVKNVTELDWWESRNISLSTKKENQNNQTVRPVKEAQDHAAGPDDVFALIGCLPCQHMGNRTFNDRGHTLWGSWSVESGGKKLWFGGYASYSQRIIPLPLTDHSPAIPATAQSPN